MSFQVCIWKVNSVNIMSVLCISLLKVAPHCRIKQMRLFAFYCQINWIMFYCSTDWCLCQNIMILGLNCIMQQTVFHLIPYHLCTIWNPFSCTDTSQPYVLVITLTSPLRLSRAEQNLKWCCMPYPFKRLFFPTMLNNNYLRCLVFNKPSLIKINWN